MTPALRPYLSADAPALAEIFQASIVGLTGEDYSDAQQEAWAAAADDAEAFAARLAGRLTLVATIEGEAVGFAALRGADHLDMLYVHPDAGRQGVASRLCDALERLVGGRGARRLTSEASDTARAFFETRGYRAERRNMVERNGEWLGTTTMVKTLAANEQGLHSS